MDENLANAVLQRQSYYVGDFMNRIILLEAKISVLEKQIEESKRLLEKEQVAKQKRSV